MFHVVLHETVSAVYNVSCDTDESSTNCNETTQFACKNGQTCISVELVNNTVNDCGDNSDEGNLRKHADYGLVLCPIK